MRPHRQSRRKATTRPGKGRWRAPDQVRRKFAVEKINRRWYGDGTEIVTGEGKLYLDSVLDMGSRRIVGFALGAHHDAGLAYGALLAMITTTEISTVRGEPRQCFLSHPYHPGKAPGIAGTYRIVDRPTSYGA